MTRPRRNEVRGEEIYAESQSRGLRIVNECRAASPLENVSP
jgi:hypothetical protein